MTTGHVPAIGTFCFQQPASRGSVTAPRIPASTLTAPAMAWSRTSPFTGNANGVQDSVPWVVWYEKGNTLDATGGKHLGGCAASASSHAGA
jgi:hypothetical protein